MASGWRTEPFKADRWMAEESPSNSSHKKTRRTESIGVREMLDHLNHSLFLELLVKHDGNRQAGDDGRVKAQPESLQGIAQSISCTPDLESKFHANQPSIRSGFDSKFL